MTEMEMINSIRESYAVELLLFSILPLATTVVLIIILSQTGKDIHARWGIAYGGVTIGVWASSFISYFHW